MLPEGSIARVDWSHACWRLANKRYADRVPFWTGSRLTGGRWHSAGRPAFYAAESKELALLELLAGYPDDALHFGLERIQDLVAMPLSLPGLDILTSAQIQPRAKGGERRRIGDRWLDSQLTAVLEVPSSVVHGGSIFMFNPGHPDFARVVVEEPRPLLVQPNPFPDLLRLLRAMYADKQQHDFFVCHASEDKQSIVAPLTAELTKQAVSLWVDEAQLRAGDSLTEKVFEGMKRSRFVLVVLTKTFLRKPFAKKELSTALGIEFSNGKKTVIPILAGSDQDVRQVIEELPWLNDKVFIRWRGPEDTSSIVDQLLEIREEI